MMAHFPASTRRVRTLLPSANLVPVEIVPGIAVVSMAAFEYRRMATLAPYNEFAVMVPVRYRPTLDVPALPLLFPRCFKDLGFWVHWLPVTTQEACDVGIALWGFPKIVADITFEESGRTRRCRVRDGGKEVVTFEMPIARGRTRLMDFVAYPVKDGAILKTLVQTRGDYDQRRLGGAWFTLGAHPIAEELRTLGIRRVAIERLYTPAAQSMLHRASARIPM